MPSLYLNQEVHFRLYTAILKNRYDVITPPPIFRSLRNLENRCKMTLLSSGGEGGWYLWGRDATPWDQ